MLVMRVTISNFAGQENFYIKQDALLSLEFENAMQGDFERPSFGIISKTGSFSFVDKDSIVKNNLQGLTTNKKFDIKIYLHNTNNNTATMIGSYKTTKWKYNANSNIVYVDFSDSLTEWQDRNVKVLSYGVLNVSPQNCATIYNYLRNQLITVSFEDGSTTPIYSYGGLDSIDDLDEKTQNILNNTYMKYLILRSGSLWENFEKLCQVCGLHIYQENGKIHCVYGL